MRLLYVIAGSGRMECDACLRDGLLARTFKAKGHEVLFVPMYTPLPANVGNPREHPLFFGGINVFLQQKLPFFRRTPRALDKFFDSPALLDFVSRFGHLTQARDLADLTVSVLEGESGNQRKELGAMLAWLAEQPRPGAIILPNSLLAGLAEPLRRTLGAPVFCLLSGEDMFIDQFPEPHRARTLEVLLRRPREIDGFILNRLQGALLAFTQHKPAVVLRCPACENVVMRVSPTPAGTFLDLRGAAYVRLGGERG
jgi:hypothetical protein